MLSKRDTFAAAALTGLLASESEGFGHRDGKESRCVRVAREAFELADAMVRESERKPAEEEATRMPHGYTFKAWLEVARSFRSPDSRAEVDSDAALAAWDRGEYPTRWGRDHWGRP